MRSLDSAAFLDFGWYMLTRNGEQQAVDKFKRALWMPPKGVEPDARSPWSPANETAAFKSFRAAAKGSS